jgi:hypothetical protein
MNENNGVKSDAEKAAAIEAAAAAAVEKAATKAAEKSDRRLSEMLDRAEKGVGSHVANCMYAILETKRGDVHLHVSPTFSSWAEYISDRLSKREIMHHVLREPVAKLLHEEGVSYPFIAKALNVSLGTAWNDCNRPKSSGTADNTPAAAQLSKRLDSVENLSKAVGKVVTNEDQRLTLSELRTLRADLAKAIDKLQAELTTVDAKIGKLQRKPRVSKAAAARAAKATAEAAASNMNPRAGQHAA